MTRILQAPASLSDQPYFVVRYDRELEEYELCLPGSDDSYLLGSAEKSRAYFARAGQEHLGGRAMDAALAFGASQALVKAQRAFGLDLTDPRIDKRGAQRDQLLTRERLFGQEDEDEVFVL